MTGMRLAPLLDSDSTLLEVAAAASEALTRNGIPAMLSGGGAASLYSEGKYLSYDLDFVFGAEEHCLPV
jgi:hypothetical protein